MRGAGCFQSEGGETGDPFVLVEQLKVPEDPAEEEFLVEV
jgi:hypothetical protein